MPATVVIFEDNNNLRESLKSLLELSDQFELIGSFSHCLQAEEHIENLKPDLILMDIDMPQRSGIEAVRQIRKINLKVQIIMLTIFDDNVHVLDAFKAGANGYLLKKYISDRLYSALLEVQEGGAPMSPSIARMIIGNIHAAESRKMDYNLSPREKDILLSLSQGNSVKIIAGQLHISPLTVGTHIRNIYEKLQVHSQTEAVIKAINEKLV